MFATIGPEYAPDPDADPPAESVAETVVEMVGDAGAPQAARSRDVALIAVPLAALAHVLVGLAFINRLDLWFDEGFTAQAMKLSWNELVSLLGRTDVNMSVYYLLLKAWTSVFGVGEVALRLPSLLLTGASVLLVGLLLRRWFGTGPAVVAALALGLSPFFLTVGVTARSYGLTSLLLVVALWLLVRAAGSRDLLPWVVLAVVDVVGLYTSATFAFWILAQAVYVVAVDRRMRWGQLLALGILGVGAVPTVVFASDENTLSWVDKTSLPDAAQTLYVVAGPRVGAALVLLAFAGLVLRPWATGGELAEHPRGRWLTATFLVVPLAVMLVVLPYGSFFVPRYLTGFFIALVLVAATAVATLRSPWWQVTAMLVTVLSVWAVLVRFVPSPAFAQENWGPVVAELDAHAQPGDALVFPNPYWRIAGEYYASEARFPTVVTPRLPDDPWFSRDPDYYDRVDLSGRTRTPQALATSLAGVTRVWLVGHDSEPTVAHDRDVLISQGWTVDHESTQDGMTLVLLTRPVA